MSGNDGPACRFDTFFRCYPAGVLGRGELNYSGIIILPPSALGKLTRLRIAYPMVLELHNVPRQKMTQAGVLEFVAEAKRVYLPYWMMRTLYLKAGELVQIKSTAIPSGSFIKLQPESTSFITAISDPKGVLENALRRFLTLTKGDKFQFLYKGNIFEIAVLDVKPQHQSGGISCLDTDLEVDFAPPLDYVEPPTSLLGGGGVKPFIQESFMAKRIGYDALAATPPSAAGPVISTAKPQPLRLPLGTLFFGYPIEPMKAGSDKAEEKKPSMFSSPGGKTLGDTTNRKRKHKDITGKETKSD
ncbi:ubiquitin fusion degradation protein UFD1-domain-containing protein [Sphaerosporella brunnea]|uniref:Ubiquitin fusion degradation protein UFD1-domain-containing protein n=1 Tax=Sphaerosporella brunnea TaxID=1250544 RepID=A0A5J5EIY8_9PEZI|nr:ubiquitin fusion degradation protein UFD1-domain-containing protein [Sphaerosporella brunnea]